MLIYPAKYMLPQQARLRSLDETQTDPSHGGIDHTNRIGFMHKWGIDITTPKLKYSDVMGLFSFACALGGQYGQCQMPNPFPAIGVGTQLALTRGLTAQGSQQVALFNLPAATPGVLEPGDFLRFSTHSKVYMVTQTLTSNGAGQGTVSITPPLRSDLTQNAGVSTGANVTFIMQLKSDKQDIHFRADKDRERAVKIEFVEFIND